MAGDAALYSRILGAALDDRADGLGAQAARGLPALSRHWNSGPSAIPAASLQARTRTTVGPPCDPFAFLIRLRSPNGEGVLAFGFEVGNVERGGFRTP